MFRIRRARERGHFDHGWLDTYHTFSFGDYDDPEYRAFRALRVMNDDRVAPGTGFGMHGHRDMEILTYVLSGALEHSDSLGHTEALRAGEVQQMTAGSGIRHCERNPSQSEPVHLYQIWLLPDRAGHEPRYAQRHFDSQARQGRWQLIASPEGAADSLPIHQDARVHLAVLEPGEALSYELAGGRHAWLQVLRGSARLNGESLAEGDGAALSDVSRLQLHSEQGSEVMLFDLA
jgi:redox-sensitive bicupin YhaK (pirin superfamily)